MVKFGLGSGTGVHTFFCTLSGFSADFPSPIVDVFYCAVTALLLVLHGSNFWGVMDGRHEGFFYEAFNAVHAMNVNGTLPIVARNQAN
jgi:hypothetical protein